MPAPPEIRDRARDVGVIEVLKEIKAEHFAKTDRHVRIAAEVKIDLEGIAQDAQPGGQNTALAERKGVDCLEDLSAAVGQQYFLGQAAHEADHALVEFVDALFPVLQHIGNIPVTDDRTGDQLRKHGDIGTEIDDGSLRIGIVTVQIDRIGHRLEGIETDADRQTQLQRLQKGDADGVEIADEEIIVFEEAQQQKIQNDADCQILSGCRSVTVAVLADHPSEDPVEQDREDHDENIDRLAPAIKKQAHNQEYEVAEPEGDEKIDCQHGRQICKQKCQTAEYHRFSL